MGGIGVEGNAGAAGLLTIILPSAAATATYTASYMKWPNWPFITRKGTQFYFIYTYCI